MSLESRYPPKNARPRVNESGDLLHPIMTFPSSTLAQSKIWDERELKQPRYKKKDLDARRANVCVPIFLLDPPHDRYPRFLESHSRHSSPSVTTR